MRLILVTADGLRPDFLGAYGNDWLPTPNLDRLASDGILFDRHFAAVPDRSWLDFRGPLLAELKERGVRVLEERTPDLPDGDCLLWLTTDELLPPWDPSDESVAAAFEDADEEVEPWPDPPTDSVDPYDDRLFERLQRSYGSAVAEFDAGFGELVEEAGAWGDDALWVVTAGYGYALGDHGVVGPHRPFLHEEVVHLPLVVRLPRSA